MSKILSCLLALSLVFTCSACEKSEDTLEISTIPPAETLDNSILRESAPSTEPPSEDTAPSLESSKPWLRYEHIRDDENAPQTLHMQEISALEKIATMVGSIEQRFYEVKPLSDKNIEAISQAWLQFSGEELNQENLVCLVNDEESPFPSLPKDQYADIQSISYQENKISLSYEPTSQSLTISRNDFPQEPVSVYTQTTSLINYPTIEIYDEATKHYSFVSSKDSRYIYREDSVKLKGKEVTLEVLLDYICNFLFTTEYYDGYLTEQISSFYAPDYKIDSFDDVSLEIQNFKDGNQAVIFKCAFTSRDMPIISDAGASTGTTKKMSGTTLEIGMFRNDEIGYIKTNYFFNQPTQIQITDPRPNMDAPVTLIDLNTAVQLADNSLTEDRILLSGKLQYATEELYDKKKVLQGYVLTPVYHFVFEPTEQESKNGYYNMFIDVDAVTSEVLKWYPDEPEQSGKKCWTTNPGYYELEENQ